MAGIQKFSGLDVGNEPNGSVEQIQDTILNASESGKSLDEMTEAEQIAYKAKKAALEEESDPNLMRALGRDLVTPKATPENIKKIIKPQVQPVPQPTPTPVVEPPKVDPIVTPQYYMAKPAPKPAPVITAEKDELSVPIHKVTEFIRLVMGQDFGYISKETAREMVDLIPKDCAILAIETSPIYAKKFIQYRDVEVRKMALKKIFDVEADEELAPYMKMFEMPGFEINPWKD